MSMFEDLDHRLLSDSPQKEPASQEPLSQESKDAELSSLRAELHHLRRLEYLEETGICLR